MRPHPSLVYDCPSSGAQVWALSRGGAGMGSQLRRHVSITSAFDGGGMPVGEARFLSASRYFRRAASVAEPAPLQVRE